MPDLRRTLLNCYTACDLLMKFGSCRYGGTSLWMDHFALVSDLLRTYGEKFTFARYFFHLLLSDSDERQTVSCCAPSGIYIILI